MLIPPLFGTERLACLQSIPTHTDLAPFHPVLFQHLQGFHLLHTTDTFYAFARTALWRARWHGIPLTTSVQTDTIGWARIYTPAILQRLLPSYTLTRWMLEQYHYLDRQERVMERRFCKYLHHCRTVFVSHTRDRERVQRLAPDTPQALLRRGLDRDSFHPCQRDRTAVEARFGIPPGRILLLFVGRLDPVKGALIAAEIVQRLAARGHNTHLLVVGDGTQRQQVAALLGERGTLTGNLPHEELATIYASADLLLFPSEAEVWPNVVMEARACGLPVLACAQGAGHVMQGHGVDGFLLPDRHLATWCAAVQALLAQPSQLREMGHQARHAAETHVPSWAQVLEEDLLPVWQRVAADSASDHP
jgi:glycosyltransferase involved in cell wall biosynthesis